MIHVKVCKYNEESFIHKYLAIVLDPQYLLLLHNLCASAECICYGTYVFLGCEPYVQIQPLSIYKSTLTNKHVDRQTDLKIEMHRNICTVVSSKSSCTLLLGTIYFLDV